MIRSIFITAVAATCLSSCANAQEIGPISTFSPDLFSQEVTECDRLASHPDDPHKVGPGTSEGKVDLPAAIEACRKAVAADPENPRLQYQMARVYGYSGRGEDATPYRIRAVEAGYPQSLFVVGYLYLNGRTIEKNVCLGADLIYKSAQIGRFAGLTFYPAYLAEGRFEGCDAPSDPEELLGFLDQAAAMTSDSYRELLIETIRGRISDRQDLAALQACHRAASHPDDPDRVAPGLESSEIDLTSAIDLCKKAYDLAPLNPRVNYQLGRVLYYDDRVEESLPYLTRAAEGGYRQAIFVLGYIKSVNERAGKDICRSGQLWRTGIDLDHPWSGYHLTAQALDGSFAGCDITVTETEMTEAMCLAKTAITPEASEGRVEALYARYLEGNHTPCQ